MIARARAVFFQLVFYAWTVLLAVLYLPVLLLPHRFMTATGAFWCRSVLWLLGRIAGIDHRVIGSENLRPAPVVYAIKHQSAWDTLMVPLLVRDPAIVLKRELLWIPLFGQYLAKQGAIGVDRKGAAAALRRLARGARRAVAAGQPLVVFPEGTRRPVGAPPAYQPGIAALYTALEVPVVPVALDSGLYWPRRSLRLRPGRITVSVLPAIPPGLDRRAFMARLVAAIEDESARLAASVQTRTEHEHLP